MLELATRLHPPPVARGERWPLLLIVVGTAACLFDALTTWIALSPDGTRFHELSPQSARLMGVFGLDGGIAVTVLVRVAAFALVAVAVERLPRISKPLLGIGFFAAAIAWLIAFGNVAALASG